MALSYGTKSIRDESLMVHLDAANPKSYPGSGDTWYDLSGNGINGTIVSAASISDGTLSVTTRTGTVEIGSSHDYSNLTNFTVDMFYRRNSVNDYGTGGAGNPSYYQGVFNYYWQESIFVGTSSNAYSNKLTVFGIETTLELGEWVHIVGVAGPGGRKAYINGELIGTASGRSVQSNKRIFIGNWDFSWGSICDIATCKIYSKELSETEIKQNFEAHRGRFGL